MSSSASNSHPCFPITKALRLDKLQRIPSLAQVISNNTSKEIWVKVPGHLEDLVLTRAKLMRGSSYLRVPLSIRISLKHRKCRAKISKKLSPLTIQFCKLNIRISSFPKLTVNITPEVSVVKRLLWIITTICYRPEVATLFKIINIWWVTHSRHIIRLVSAMFQRTLITQATTII